MIVFCRAGVLPVGETSRSDRGGGVSAEECSRRKLSGTSHLSAKQIIIYVGMVIDHPHGRGIGSYLWFFNNGNARHSADDRWSSLRKHGLIAVNGNDKFN
jgi:hypothetical protein